MTLVSEYLHMLEDRKYMPKEIIVIYFLNAEKRLFNLPVPVLHYLFITPVTWSFFNLISKPEMFVYSCSIDRFTIFNQKDQESRIRITVETPCQSMQCLWNELFNCFRHCQSYFMRQNWKRSPWWRRAPSPSPPSPPTPTTSQPSQVNKNRTEFCTSMNQYCWKCDLNMYGYTCYLLLLRF